MKTLLKIFIGTGLLFSLSGCQKAMEAYLGFPMQPDNIDAEFKPGLNVFGLIKAGPSMDTLNHFFEVHRILHVFDTAATMTLDEAQIELTRHRDGNPSIDYQLRSIANGRYTSPFITTEAGDYWEYQCIYDTFLIKATTRVPNQPKIMDGSFYFAGNKLHFTLEPDTTAYMYDIYYLSSDDFVHQRKIPQQPDPTAVTLEVKTEPYTQGGLLYVIAYDANYERYHTTANTFFKPNAYRPRFSTVNGGYGCFGSAHILEKQF
ncbi:MAG: hypothetical protein AB7S69_14525 [Salinivirgaceae bacterium]|jgi:hypothetical protein